MDLTIIKQFYESGLESLAMEALNNIPSVIEIKNRQMTNLYINDVGLAISGFKREDVVGKNSLDFVQKSEHQRFIESTNQLFAEGKLKRIAHLINIKGKIFTIISSIKIVKYQGKDFSIHNWFEATGYPELFDLVYEKEKYAQKQQKTVSGEIVGLYKVDILDYLITSGHFADPGLTLIGMSVQLSIPQKYISLIIKKEFGLVFNDFVNYLRLREFKRLQVHPESRRFTREGIARSAGFPSAPTFYRAQKKLNEVFIHVPLQSNI